MKTAREEIQEQIDSDRRLIARYEETVVPAMAVGMLKGRIDAYEHILNEYEIGRK